MLSEALPIYSGRLGNVAGDQLKAASDLGVPVVGVGLLYQQGYFRQMIDQGGTQQALYPYNDPGQLPVTPLRQANGEWLRLEIPLPGYSVWLRAWQVKVGRVKLCLPDSNDAANFPAHRGITSELYGGGPELRLKQEIVLGIGGWRLLRALGLRVWDAALFKIFPITESKYLEFRSEFFNFTNHPTFSAPGTRVDRSSGGHIGSTLNAARQIQMALMFYF